MSAAAGFLAGLLIPSLAAAAAGSWAAEDAIRGRLVASVDATGQLERIPAGLHLELADGWKTYWRSPGDAGTPPTIDWSASGNVAGVRMQWPAPHRFSLFGIDTFGYTDEVVFPLELEVERPGEPVALRGTADILVCSDVCVPTTLSLSLDLPPGTAGIDPAAAGLIARYRARVPDDGRSSGISVQGAAVRAGDDPRLVVDVASTTLLQSPDLIVESERWSFGPPVVDRVAGGLRAELPIVSGPDAVTLPGEPVTITVLDETLAAEHRLTAASLARSSSWTAELLPMIALGLLGGLILNLMPCVLPVLSLKLMSVLGQQGREHRQIRVGFLVTAVGVLTSMLALAGILVGLRLAGAEIGWGMQFQQPLFLIVMSAAVIIFAANMAGAFEFRLPAAIATRMGQAGGDGMAGHFATGAFATLLATPCSAPFLGTAIGFAFARGPLEILAIFASLGLGLSLPYLAVALFPGLVELLPRPGRWMAKLRLILAAALAATAVWLLTILAAQTSAVLALGIGTALTAAVAAVAVAARVQRRYRPALVAIPLLLVAGTVLPAVSGPGTAVRSAPGLHWSAFDEAAIPRLVAEGRTVFVDVTADWCITCIANKSLVLEQPEVASALRAGTVVAMQADWTNPDPRIAGFLARHDRYGIPFNIVYGPGAPRGIVLPELLTAERVLTALDTAGAVERGGDVVAVERGPSPSEEAR